MFEEPRKGCAHPRLLGHDRAAHLRRLHGARSRDLVEPRSIERFLGKAKRVLDRRDLGK
jgi:hypothetical protein